MKRILFISVLFAGLFCNAEETCSSRIHAIRAFRKPTQSEQAFVGKNVTLRDNVSLAGDDRLLIYEMGVVEQGQQYPEEPRTAFKIIADKKVIYSLEVNKLRELATDRQFADGLRVTELAFLCRPDGQSMTVVASQSGATGESQLFLVFVGVAGKYRSFSLPISTKGRLEWSAKEPLSFKLWSISENDSLGAARAHYVVTVYELDSDGFHKKSVTRTDRMYDPSLFIEQPLVLH